jgi:leucyl aminopeptidase
MLRNLFKRNFTKRAKIVLVNESKKVTNCIFFATEGEVKSNTNALTNVVRLTSPKRFEDIKKQKMSLIYPWAQDLFFSERMLFVNSPNDPEKLRGLACKAIRSFQSYRPDNLHIYFSDHFPIHNRRIVINSLILSNYSFKKEGTYKPPKDTDATDSEESEKKEPYHFIPQLSIFNDKYTSKYEDSIKLWINLANANLYTRSLANERPNVATCDYFEEVARDLAGKRESTAIEVIRGDSLLKNELNLLHAVGKSAQSAPRLIVLTYKGDKANKTFSHAIVGKGLTFDTGGLNLKPTNYIEDMYLDKHGACNTLAIFKNVVDMQLPINIVCAIGVAENSIDSASYKPSDIIKSHKGLTVEITNTDAEGRLVLADVLSYVQDKYKPENIIDMATLTGACMVALVIIKV